MGWEVVHNKTLISHLSCFRHGAKNRQLSLCKLFTMGLNLLHLLPLFFYLSCCCTFYLSSGHGGRSVCGMPSDSLCLVRRLSVFVHLVRLIAAKVQDPEILFVSSSVDCRAVSANNRRPRALCLGLPHHTALQASQPPPEGGT